MTLKQTQEEELKLVDKALSREEISKLLVENSMPTRQVFISELRNRINRCLLSAMEASAKGAIEATRITSWEEMGCDCNMCYVHEKDIKDQAIKAKDYLGDTHD